MSALGTELKFNVHIDPLDGLHMSEYDFEVALYVFTNRKILFPKSAMTMVDEDNYLLCVETPDALRIGRGKINAEITAYIPDSDFSDGLRTEKLMLCTNAVVV